MRNEDCGLTLADKLALRRFATMDSFGLVGANSKTILIIGDRSELADMDVLGRLVSSGLLETFAGRVRVSQAGLRLARPPAAAWPRRASVRR